MHWKFLSLGLWRRLQSIVRQMRFPLYHNFRRRQCSSTKTHITHMLIHDDEEKLSPCQPSQDKQTSGPALCFWIRRGLKFLVSFWSHVVSPEKSELRINKGTHNPHDDEEKLSPLLTEPGQPNFRACVMCLNLEGSQISYQLLITRFISWIIRT